MEPAETIRQCIAQVTDLRIRLASEPQLSMAVKTVKRLQSRRFALTYADLLAGGPYQAAARFFLAELYGDADYVERDAQFSKIAGAIQHLLPTQAVQTAVALAHLHVLSEQLDHAMGQNWLGGSDRSDTVAYIEAWRSVGRRPDRHSQVRMVLEIGTELIRLTRTPGLRLMLRMMRGPAHAAGLGALHQFLETGFDTFAGLEKRESGAREFLAMIERRENLLIAQLFDADLLSFKAGLASKPNLAT